MHAVGRPRAGARAVIAVRLLRALAILNLLVLASDALYNVISAVAGP